MRASSQAPRVPPNTAPSAERAGAQVSVIQGAPPSSSVTVGRSGHGSMSVPRETRTLVFCRPSLHFESLQATHLGSAWQQQLSLGRRSGAVESWARLPVSDKDFPLVLNTAVQLSSR